MDLDADLAVGGDIRFGLDVIQRGHAIDPAADAIPFGKDAIFVPFAFLDGGEVQLQLDCNRGRSTWTAGQPANGAGNISFGPVAGTRMACPAPSFGNDLASGLEQAQRFTTTIDGRQLVLETPDLRFTFAAAE